MLLGQLLQHLSHRADHIALARWTRQPWSSLLLLLSGMVTRLGQRGELRLLLLQEPGLMKRAGAQGLGTGRPKGLRSLCSHGWRSWRLAGHVLLLLQLLQALIAPHCLCILLPLLQALMAPHSPHVLATVQALMHVSKAPTSLLLLPVPACLACSPSPAGNCRGGSVGQRSCCPHRGVGREHRALWGGRCLIKAAAVAGGHRVAEQALVHAAAAAAASSGPSICHLG